MKKNILIFAMMLTFVCNSSIAQNINVKCNITNGDGKFFRLEKISDYISNKHEIIYSSYIDKSNSISFSFESQEIEEYIIYVDFAQSSIFLAPNTSYTLDITLPVTDNVSNPFTNVKYLNVKIKSSSQNDINELITQFNYAYDDFLYENITSILQGSKAKHDTFKKNILDSLNKYNNHFLSTYAEYSFACTELSLSSISKQSLADNYLHNKSVELRNPMYMQFLDDFCKNTMFSPDKSTTDNELLIQLTSIRNISKLLNSQTYPKEQIIALLEKAENQTTYKEIKHICQNLIDNATLLMPGTRLPKLNVITPDGKTIDITEINTRDKYLFFYKSNINRNNNALDTLQNSAHIATKGFTVIPIDLSATPTSEYKPENNIMMHETLFIREYPFVVIVDGNGDIIE